MQIQKTNSTENMLHKYITLQLEFLYNTMS